jgi:hypothetical protein
MKCKNISASTLLIGNRHPILFPGSKRHYYKIINRAAAIPHFDAMKRPMQCLDRSRRRRQEKTRLLMQYGRTESAVFLQYSTATLNQKLLQTPPKANGAVKRNTRKIAPNIALRP